MADFDLLVKEAEIKEPPKEVFRAVYRRRGSEVYISATKDARVLVTRFRTRANAYEYWIYDHAFIKDNATQVKEWLEKEKYLKVEAKPVDEAV